MSQRLKAIKTALRTELVHALAVGLRPPRADGPVVDLPPVLDGDDPDTRRLVAARKEDGELVLAFARVDDPDDQCVTVVEDVIGLTVDEACDQLSVDDLCYVLDSLARPEPTPRRPRGAP